MNALPCSAHLAIGDGRLFESAWSLPPCATAQRSAEGLPGASPTLLAGPGDLSWFPYAEDQLPPYVGSLVEEDAGDPRYIETVWGVGYRMREPE